MGVRIVIDSSTDLAAGIKNRFTVVPLIIRFGDEEFLDGVNITHKEFYERLIESDVMPITSQASPDAFEQVYKEAVSAGDSVVVICLSSKLSGTFQSATIAAEDYEGKVFVVDSRSVAIGTGILAEFALKLVDQGCDAETVSAKLTEERENIRIIALLDTLEYLKRGGRISKTVAIAGSLLSIKPVVDIKDGEVGILGKARGSRQGNNLLVSEIQAAGGVDFSKPLLLGYTGLTDILLQKYIDDSADLWKNNVDSLNTTVISSVVGTHAGPGAIAVAFFRNTD